MKVINGEMNYAKVFVDSLDDNTNDQIIEFLKCPVFKNEKIRIMPDTHAGAGAVIGFTCTTNNKVYIPNVVGVDLGCGIYAYNLGKIDIDFDSLENFIRRNIPTGYSKHKSYKDMGHNLHLIGTYGEEINILNIEDFIHNNMFRNELDENIFYIIEYICEKIKPDDKEYFDNTFFSLNTLGGGNHFIEIDKDNEDNYWLCIHCGSRNFGLQVAQYHQNKAKELCETFYQTNYKNLEFLPADIGGSEYLLDMKVAQNYAHINRTLIAYNIINNFFGLDFHDLHKIETVHNYINFEDNIVRKGAISAHKNEEVLIPINMRDGTIIGVGKGNHDWNCSAPHGAGRLMGRREAKRTLSFDDFKDTMKDVWSKSVTESTLDEAPDAYKSIDSIMSHIDETIDIKCVMKPVYNLKAT